MTKSLKYIGDPYGNRTRVFALRGRCPRPLDEGVAVPVLAGGQDIMHHIEGCKYLFPTFAVQNRSKRARKSGDPYGIRTRVAGVKGQCPRPLDEGVAWGGDLQGHRWEINPSDECNDMEMKMAPERLLTTPGTLYAAS